MVSSCQSTVGRDPMEVLFSCTSIPSDDVHWQYLTEVHLVMGTDLNLLLKLIWYCADHSLSQSQIWFAGYNTIRLLHTCITLKVKYGVYSLISLTYPALHPGFTIYSLPDLVIPAPCATSPGKYLLTHHTFTDSQDYHTHFHIIMSLLSGNHFAAGWTVLWLVWMLKESMLIVTFMQ